MKTRELLDALPQLSRTIASHRQAGNYRAAADLGLEVGHALYQAQEWDKACPFLEAAINDNYHTSGGPPDGVLRAYPLWMTEVPKCRYWLGCSQASLKRYPQAIANLRRAAEASAVTNYHKRAADSFLMWGGALRDYGFATNRERLLRMALAKYEQANHQFKEAVDWEEKGAEVGPGVAYINAAPAYCGLHMYDEVIDAYADVKQVRRRYGDKKQRRWAAEAYELALEGKKKADSHQ